MYIKKQYEAKKNEANSFDFADAEEDSKRFDFQNLIYRLTLFKTWLEDLHDEIGSFADPKLINGAAGTSGYKYTIHSGVRDTIQFDIDCGTNPERYPEFEGSIFAGDERFDITSRKDLTAALIKKIAAAYKKGAEKGAEKGADK